MNILFFCRLFYPHIGGVEKHVIEISKILIKKGHTVTVITENSENAKEMETINGIKVYRIPVGSEDKNKKFRIWSWLWKNKKIILQADIVHCHDVFFWYLPFRFLFPSKPVYTTFHGYESYPIKVKAKMIRKLSEKLSKGNICIGDFIQKWYGTKPTYVSYGAVDIPKETHKKFDKESAIFIGRLDEQTGIRTYVDAVATVKKSVFSFKFLVVGDGPDKKYVRANGKVIGFQRDPEKYFSDYHFAFVSRYLSILEAFAAKRLVFAVYDNPVKEDYLRMAPYAKWIVIESDPEKLAERVKYFLNHPEEEKVLVERAYKWVEKQSWKNMVSLYTKLWGMSS